MEGTDQILDQNLSPQDGSTNVVKNLASGGRRFGNYLIDAIVYYVIIFVLAMIAGLMFGEDILVFFDEEGSGILVTYFFSFLLYFLYYFVMEASFGKTIGKFITGTKVVTEDGEKPSAKTLAGRTLCRFIPFEAFSFLGSSAIGWHDSISNTRVING